MRRAEILCAVGLLVGAIVILQEALRLGAGWGPTGPRAGFFPFWLAALLAASSLVNLVKAVRIPAGTSPLASREAMKSVLAVLLPALGAFALFELVGFYVTAALFLAASSRWLGRHGWTTIATVSLLFPMAIYLVIERWFLIPLPKGLFGGSLLNI